MQAQIHQNQPYDESLDVPDAEEIASQYTPTPRHPRGSRAGSKCTLPVIDGNACLYKHVLHAFFSTVDAHRCLPSDHFPGSK